MLTLKLTDLLLQPATIRVAPVAQRLIACHRLSGCRGFKSRPGHGVLCPDETLVADSA